MVDYSLWEAYLRESVNRDLYVWGANGEKLVDILDKIYDMEKTKSDVDRVLTLLKSRIKAGISIFDIRCSDCSGLSIRFLLENKIITSDTTANGLYEYIVGTEKKIAHGKNVTLKNIKAGDFVFMGSESNKYHVGYAISKTQVIENMNHDVGVVITNIAERNWKYAARPDWWTNLPKEPDVPEPTVYIFTRELFLVKNGNLMSGSDVKVLQEKLNSLNFNCGTADGVFGKLTEAAVKNYQRSKGLKDDGIVGKKTVESLGFKWQS